MVFSTTSFTPQSSFKQRLERKSNENGFGRAFATLFGQDFEIFTRTMFLNMDQLQKQLDNNEFQEIGSMASFKVLETQFQMFIKSKIYLNDEYIVMTRNYFLEYTRLDIPEFRDTLIQNMDYVKKSIEKRALHKMEYDSRVNERQIQTTEEKIDTSNALDALDASSVIIESNGTESQEQDTSSRSGNDAHVDDADIRPIYDEEPKAEVQMTADDNVSATGQQHTEQPESNNEGEVDQNADQCYDTRPLPAKLTDNRTTELSNQLLESENVCLKKTVAQCQKDFAKLEAHCINLELQMENNVLKSGQQSQFLKEKENEQIRKKGFAIAPLKMSLRENNRNSVNISLLKPSNLGKPAWTTSKTNPLIDKRLRFKSEDLDGFQQEILRLSTTKVESETQLLNADIPNQCECEQALNVSAGLVLHQMTSDLNVQNSGIQDTSMNSQVQDGLQKLIPFSSQDRLHHDKHHKVVRLRNHSAECNQELEDLPKDNSKDRNSILGVVIDVLVLKLLSVSYAIHCDILLEHPSDTKVFHEDGNLLEPAFKQVLIIARVMSHVGQKQKGSQEGIEIKTMTKAQKVRSQSMKEQAITTTTKTKTKNTRALNDKSNLTDLIEGVSSMITSEENC
ncbi:hypothetical protein Tco_0802094 [Tanacetum coccineum]|uniref:Uncharacterized protein n=1 Tax=Tanacetum coccineum TaxID=301880 RepID=A0ABQ5A058_9ASTR